VYFEFQQRLPGQLEPDSGSRTEGFVFKSWMLIGQNQNLLDTDWCILNFSTDCLGSWKQTLEPDWRILFYQLDTDWTELEYFEY
jgi:hypothetical protein